MSASMSRWCGANSPPRIASRICWVRSAGASASPDSRTAASDMAVIDLSSSVSGAHARSFSESSSRYAAIAYEMRANIVGNLAHRRRRGAR